MLCSLLEKMMPSLNTQMHVEPVKQFEMIKNINLFLTAAKETFRIRDSFLFTADELYYCQDVHKVSMLLQSQQGGGV